MQFSPNVHAVVIAGSFEGIRALTRLINMLPHQFPVPIVASLHGPCDEELERIIRARTSLSDRLTKVHAMDGDTVRLGRVYVVPGTFEVAFKAKNLISVKPSLDLQDGQLSTTADRLFDSAARIYGKGAIGVVLSGRGRDGTAGLKAITDVGGTRIVQCPTESSHPAMPTHALLADHVEFSVLLDDMGALLNQLVNR